MESSGRYLDLRDIGPEHLGWTGDTEEIFFIDREDVGRTMGWTAQNES